MSSAFQTSHKATGTSMEEAAEWRRSGRISSRPLRSTVQTEDKWCREMDEVLFGEDFPQFGGPWLQDTCTEREWDGEGVAAFIFVRHNLCPVRRSSVWKLKVRQSSQVWLCLTRKNDLYSRPVEINLPLITTAWVLMYVTFLWSQQ